MGNMKIFLTVCIACVVFISAKPAPPVQITANPVVAAAIQSVKDFISEANILKILRVIAASSPDIQAILDALQGIPDQGYKCVSKNVQNYVPEIVSGNLTLIETLQEVANNECSKYDTQLSNLAFTLESVNFTSLTDDYSFISELPLSLQGVYQEVINASFQIIQNPTEANQQAVNNANIKFLTALLNADAATTAFFVAQQPLAAEVLLPNGTFNPAFRAYLQQSIYALAKNASFNYNTFLNASLILNEFYIQVLPETLAWIQAEIDSVVIPATVIADTNLVKGAKRLSALTVNIDELVTNPDFLNTLNQLSTGTFVLPTSISGLPAY